MPQDEGSDSSDDSDEEADAAADRRAQETRNLVFSFMVYPGVSWYMARRHRLHRKSSGPLGENPGFHGAGLGELEEADSRTRGSVGIARIVYCLTKR